MNVYDLYVFRMYAHKFILKILSGGTREGGRGGWEETRELRTAGRVPYHEDVPYTTWWRRLDGGSRRRIGTEIINRGNTAMMRTATEESVAHRSHLL